MAIIGIARKAAGPDNEAAVKGGGEADLGAKLVTDAGLALGNTIDLGFMQGKELVLALRPLSQQAPDQPERFEHLVAQGSLRNVQQMTTQVPANIALALAQPVPASFARPTGSGRMRS